MLISVCILLRFACVPRLTDESALVVKRGCSAGRENFTLIVPVAAHLPGNIRPCGSNIERTDPLYALWISNIVWDTGAFPLSLASSSDPW
jgi:hypothetical protein